MGDMNEMLEAVKRDIESTKRSLQSKEFGSRNDVRDEIVWSYGFMIEMIGAIQNESGKSCSNCKCNPESTSVDESKPEIVENLLSIKRGRGRPKRSQVVPPSSSDNIPE